MHSRVSMSFWRCESQAAMPFSSRHLAPKWIQIWRVRAKWFSHYLAHLHKDHDWWLRGCTVPSFDTVKDIFCYLAMYRPMISVLTSRYSLHTLTSHQQQITTNHNDFAKKKAYKMLCRRGHTADFLLISFLQEWQNMTGIGQNWPSIVTPKLHKLPQQWQIWEIQIKQCYYRCCKHNTTTKDWISPVSWFDIFTIFCMGNALFIAILFSWALFKSMTWHVDPEWNQSPMFEIPLATLRTTREMVWCYWECLSFEATIIIPLWHLKISIKSSWNRSSYLQGSRCHLWEGYWNFIDGAQLHILYQILCWPNMPICLLPENIKPRPDWHGSLVKTPSPFSAKVYVWEKRGLKWNFFLSYLKGGV